ncbi:MAG: hypothetical protein QOG23_4675 [Blastocatellia bacterium]|jgi:hypothetical protein|nr:hypothetical protein [Blastocatellia bacterium]
MKKHILIYGLCGGALIVLLKLIEYRFLIVEHSIRLFASSAPSAGRRQSNLEKNWDSYHRPLPMERGHPVRQRAQPAQTFEEDSLDSLVRAARSGGQDVRAPFD